MENPAYLKSDLITYIGNKRSLLPLIEAGVEQVKRKLRQDRLSCLDLFAGSGVVSRFFKQHASTLICNDLEDYARVVNQCYLSNAETLDYNELEGLQALGELSTFEASYNTFRGSRNLGARSPYVTEYLFLLEKH